MDEKENKRIDLCNWFSFAITKNISSCYHNMIKQARNEKYIEDNLIERYVILKRLQDSISKTNIFLSKDIYDKYFIADEYIDYISNNIKKTIDYGVAYFHYHNVNIFDNHEDLMSSIGLMDFCLWKEEMDKQKKEIC